MEDEAEEIHICVLDGLRGQEIVRLERDAAFQVGWDLLVCPSDCRRQVLTDKREVGMLLRDRDRHETEPAADVDDYPVLRQSTPGVVRGQTLEVEARPGGEGEHGHAEALSLLRHFPQVHVEGVRAVGESDGRLRRLGALRPLFDSVDGIRGDGPEVVGHHGGPRDGCGVAGEEERHGRVGDEPLCRLLEDVVEHATAEDALEGDFVGFGEGGEGCEGDCFTWGHGLGDLEARDIVEGEGGCMLGSVSIVK